MTVTDSQMNDVLQRLANIEGVVADLKTSASFSQVGTGGGLALTNGATIPDGNPNGMRLLFTTPNTSYNQRWLLFAEAIVQRSDGAGAWYEMQPALSITDRESNTVLKTRIGGTRGYPIGSVPGWDNAFCLFHVSLKPNRAHDLNFISGIVAGSWATYGAYCLTEAVMLGPA